MTFKQIYSRAIGRKGEQALAASLPRVKTRQALIRATDDSYLSEMAKCVFRSGFVWKIVEKKWSNFEIAFAGFNPKAIASFSDERLESLAQDKSIIRNMTKILSTRENAKFILETIPEHKSFGRFLADWPEDDIVGLLLYLKKHGNRLGGHTGQYFLRFVGKDTFMFSKDVVTVLVAEGIVDKEPTSQRALRATQEAFNHWREETGLPYSHLSRIMAASVGPPV
ncbi:MAG: DNA-3-methyladenine glycosylase I [Gammaproteobacteria bacterium]|nr:DNA-3-methyladenine glycosylase I [Gammaproteobacteria bacterium]